MRRFRVNPGRGRDGANSGEVSFHSVAASAHSLAIAPCGANAKKTERAAPPLTYPCSLPNGLSAFRPGCAKWRVFPPTRE